MLERTPSPELGIVREFEVEAPSEDEDGLWIPSVATLMMGPDGRKYRAVSRAVPGSEVEETVWILAKVPGQRGISGVGEV
jgi:hypothetical protein